MRTSGGRAAGFPTHSTTCSTRTLASSRRPNCADSKSKSCCRTLISTLPPDPTTPGRANDRWIENPYLGLRAFREADHARFFGQEQLVERLLAHVLDSTNFTAVVGPSGSGKSSAVQAGLIPRIRQDHPEHRDRADAAGRPPLQCPRCCARGDQASTATRSFATILAEPNGSGRMRVRDASGRRATSS